MNENLKLMNGEMKVEIAPWFQQLLKAKQKEKYRVSDEIIQEKLKKGIDAAQYIYSIQTDKNTGKQYKMVETVSGNMYRVAVNPSNDPDEPLYTQDEINRMGNYFLTSKGHKMKKLRNYAYFIFTINTWRRAGDNLHLTIGDVVNQDGTFKDWLVIRNEEKTKKKSITPINSAVIQALGMYLDVRGNYNLTDLLFPADFRKNKAMTVDGMCKVLQRAAEAVGLTQRIGTHSLRKTGARNYYMMADNKTEALEEIGRVLKHSSVHVTRLYIMIEQQDIQRKFEERKLEVN